MKFACVLMLMLWTALPAGAADRDDDRVPLQLSLKRAVDIATSPEGNSNIQLAGEGVKQAQARSAEARASLLPDFEASVGDSVRVVEDAGERVEQDAPEGARRRGRPEAPDRAQADGQAGQAHVVRRELRPHEEPCA